MKKTEFLKSHKSPYISTFSAGIVASIFGCTGPMLIIVNAAANMNLTLNQTVSWVFAIYFMGGLLGICLSLRYKMPISGAYSIAGAAMILNSGQMFTFNEMVFTYLVSGIIILLVGISGYKEKVIKLIPMPIVMGMIAGVLTKFCINMILAVGNNVIIGVIILLVFFIALRYVPKIPPILFALFAGMIFSFLVNDSIFSESNLEWILPSIYLPSISLDAIIKISIPLSILILGSENTQAIGVLISQGYKPPINTMTIFSGIASILAALFGGHAANIAGPMTAICASPESSPDKNYRFMASVINGIIYLIFGIFASISIGIIKLIPSNIIAILAGLALISVLMKSYKDTFCSSNFKMGGLFSFLVALSGINIFGITSPLFALITGLVISFIVETSDFKNI